MFDVNPLGPMMHLEEIEREALTLRAAKVNIRPGNAAAAWVMKVLRRPSISLKPMSAGDSAPVGRR